MFGYFMLGFALGFVFGYVFYRYGINPLLKIIIKRGEKEND